MLGWALEDKKAEADARIVAILRAAGAGTFSVALSLLGCPLADWSEVSLLVIYCKTTLPQTIVRPRVPVLGVVGAERQFSA